MLLNYINKRMGWIRHAKAPSKEVIGENITKLKTWIVKINTQ
jgi:hypothetical protein